MQIELYSQAISRFMPVRLSDVDSRSPFHVSQHNLKRIPITSTFRCEINNLIFVHFIHTYTHAPSCTHNHTHYVWVPLWHAQQLKICNFTLRLVVHACSTTSLDSNVEGVSGTSRVTICMHHIPKTDEPPLCVFMVFWMCTQCFANAIIKSRESRKRQQTGTQHVLVHCKYVPAYPPEFNVRYGWLYIHCKICERLSHRHRWMYVVHILNRGWKRLCFKRLGILWYPIYLAANG